MSGAFAAVFIALYAGHQVGDHWVQTNAQALAKGLPGWRGRAACLRHAATLTGTLAVVLITVGLATGARLSVPAVAAGLAVNGVSHYWADRRSTLAALAAMAGKSQLWALGSPRPGHDDNPVLGTGAYALDQSWHLAWLVITALIIARGSL